MNFYSASVFQAYCFGHDCHLSLGEQTGHLAASLVTISSQTARVRMNDMTAMPREGDRAALAPRFLDGVQIGDIEARVESVSGRDLQLSFSRPLPMSGSRLCQLTKR